MVLRRLLSRCVLAALVQLGEALEHQSSFLQPRRTAASDGAGAALGGKSTIGGDVTCGARGDHDAVVILLVPRRDSKRRAGQSDFQLTLRALTSLKHMKDQGRAQVRIFHDKADYWHIKDLQTLVHAVAPREACTVGIDLAKFPKGLDLRGYRGWTTPLRKQPSTWGYHHMIRFMFVDIFESSLLNGYKYWMRLDSDAAFQADFADPFKYMDERPEIGYLHYEEDDDCGPVAKGLHHFAHEWCAKLGRADVDAIAKATPPGECVLSYYNNAEIGRIADFQTAPMQEWRDAVTASGGIYKHRWGDALLRRLAIEFYDVKTVPLPDDFLASYVHMR